MIGTPKWYEKLGIGYNGSFNNSFSFYDTVKYGQNGVKPLFQYLLDTAQWTARHNIPISLSLPPSFRRSSLISPGVSRIVRTGRNVFTIYNWDTAGKKVDTSFRKECSLSNKLVFLWDLIRQCLERTSSGTQRSLPSVMSCAHRSA